MPTFSQTAVRLNGGVVEFVDSSVMSPGFDNCGWGSGKCLTSVDECS